MSETAAPETAAASLPQYPVWLTGGLALVIVGGFAWELTIEGSARALDFSHNFRTATLYDAGALYRPAIQEGQWWRLLTATFLHANLLHLLLNGLMLVAIGWRLERYLGAGRMLLVYLMSGLGGAVITFGFTLHSRDFAVGSSGAIFGLGGALIGFSLRNRAVLWRQAVILSLVLAANLALIATVPGIDQLAHLTGLAGGLLFGFFSTPSGPHFFTRPLLILSLSWLFLFSSLFFLFLGTVRPA